MTTSVPLFHCALCPVPCAFFSKQNYELHVSFTHRVFCETCYEEFTNTLEYELHCNAMAHGPCAEKENMECAPVNAQPKRTKKRRLHAQPLKSNLRTVIAGRVAKTTRRTASRKAAPVARRRVAFADRVSEVPIVGRAQLCAMAREEGATLTCPTLQVRSIDEYREIKASDRALFRGKNDELNKAINDMFLDGPRKPLALARSKSKQGRLRS